MSMYRIVLVTENKEKINPPFNLKRLSDLSFDGVIDRRSSK